jgi:hypothetical protein
LILAFEGTDLSLVFSADSLTETYQLLPDLYPPFCFGVERGSSDNHVGRLALSEMISTNYIIVIRRPRGDCAGNVVLG